MLSAQIFKLIGFLSCNEKVFWSRNGEALLTYSFARIYFQISEAIESLEVPPAPFVKFLRSNGTFPFFILLRSCLYIHTEVFVGLICFFFLFFNIGNKILNFIYSSDLYVITPFEGGPYYAHSHLKNSSKK